MTTVRVTGADYKMNLVEAVYGWLAHDNVVVPHDTLYPDGKTEEQSTQENAEEFSQSQESAKVAALKALDDPGAVPGVVSHRRQGQPGRGQAARRRRDQGRRRHRGQRSPTTSPSWSPSTSPARRSSSRSSRRRQAAAAEKARQASRRHREASPITTEKADDGDRAIVGIQAGTDHTFPFTIDIKLADVGGPSAGLMFALGIVDKLTAGRPDRRQVRRGHRHHRRRGQGRARSAASR